MITAIPMPPAAYALPEHPWQVTRSAYLANLAYYEYLGPKAERPAAAIEADLKAAREAHAAAYGAYWPRVLIQTGKNAGEFKRGVERDFILETESRQSTERIRLLEGELRTAVAYERRVTSLQDRHRGWIDMAVRDNKPVPAQVLAEYPDIAARAAREACCV